jgi:hypothetical protein
MSDIRFLWDLYWPVLAIAVVLAVVGGLFLFRPRPRRIRQLGLVALALAVTGITALWHGPLGAADRFQGSIEQVARTTLDYFEMGQVQARLERGPMTRTLVLSGPADDFQRGELLRIMDEVPGVFSVRWANSGGGFDLPLLALAELIGLAGFGLGLALAYLIEVRRRARAEWRW